MSEKKIQNAGQQPHLNWSQQIWDHGKLQQSVAAIYESSSELRNPSSLNSTVHLLHCCCVVLLLLIIVHTENSCNPKIPFSNSLFTFSIILGYFEDSRRLFPRVQLGVKDIQKYPRVYPKKPFKPDWSSKIQPKVLFSSFMP